MAGETLTIRLADADLIGDLVVPRNAVGVVVFAHGSGSSRGSPRNREVASRLNGAGLGTLLLDLLTVEEERLDRRTARLRFEIPLLAERVVAAIDSLAGETRTSALPLGCFGASTGAAAALIAAARRPERVRAVVSRGGRPDLAGGDLEAVAAPTLLIVGGADAPVLELNRQARGRLGLQARVEVVEGATHLFEEPGALDRVAELACGWFLSYLTFTPDA